MELEGIEPSSKRGSHTLSTCLFQTSVFVPWQDLDHPSWPYPLKSHLLHEAATDYPRFCCTATLNASGPLLSVRCLVSSPSKEIKPIYYTSIRQREQSCFRQIILWELGLKSQPTTLCMLTYHLIPLSNPINPIFDYGSWQWQWPWQWLLTMTMTLAISDKWTQR